VGRPDVLLTQFSLANWAGNPGDVASMRKLAAEKLEQIRLQLAVYRPRILIPFASFVWFCRSDNYHMNAGVNRISAVFDAFKDEVDCVVLYPDDVYTPGSPHDSVSAVRRYEHDMAQKQAPLELNEASVSEAELSTLSASHAAKIRSRNWLWLFRPLVALGRLKPVHIHLTDLGRSLKYSMFDGISRTNVRANGHRIHELGDGSDAPSRHRSSSAGDLPNTARAPGSTSAASLSCSAATKPDSSFRPLFSIRRS
jgi:UDP-MurNAc hydroxylase